MSGDGPGDVADGVPDDDARERLGNWLAAALGAERVVVEGARALTGGAIQQNVALDLRVRGAGAAGTAGAAGDGAPLAAVLRRDAPATIAESRGRREEHAVLEAAHAAGVTVPRPLAFCDDPDVIGAPFSVVERVAGTALGQKVVKDVGLGGDREALVERLGAELARIHAIDRHDPDLGFVGRGADDPPRDALTRLRTGLDALGAARPALEAGLRWLERRRPAPGARVLLHRDFRTGNLMLDARGLTAVLDWEFVGVGDPHEDLGWFCARCWRFSRPELEAGGLGSRAAFYRGYERASGRRVDDVSVRWWERLAHLRWAVIALQQGRRHASGRERSLSLALTGQLAHALELRVLDDVLADASPGARVDDAATGPRRAPARRATATGRDLLATARETLADVAARATGADRLDVLMSAAAIGTVQRLLDAAERLETLGRGSLDAAGAAAPSALVRALRSGAHDDDARLHAALLRECALRAWVARPDDVDGTLRARHGLEPGDGPPA